MKRPVLKWGLLGIIILCRQLSLLAQLNNAEYFFDSDPGAGHATAIAISTPSDTVTLSPSLPTNSLSSGVHNLFIRFKSSTGAWGLYEGRPFYLFTAGAVSNPAHINKAEYFFDNDPGTGNGTAISVPTAGDTVSLALNISGTGLTTGVHNLFIRYRYDNGTWGLYEGRPFYIYNGAVANTAHINGAEYFFDTDPGVGNATATSVPTAGDTVSLALNISSTGLSTGVHNLFIRYRYDNGTWGFYEGRPFYIYNGAVLNTAHVNAAEYFFDTDPGVGNATPLTVSTPGDTVSLALNISASSLTTGVHNLFIRYRYDNGTWGLYEGRPFYIYNGAVLNTAHVNAAEYFFDNDPGIGSAHAITVATPGDTVSLALNISSTGLVTGVHNLFVRYRYDNGTWGLYEGRPFYIYTGAVINTAHINSAEYFFDADPGLGSATPVTVSTPGDTVSLALNISSTGLAAGAHNLFVRYRYDNGTWGLYEGRPFYIYTGAVLNTAHIFNAEYFFDHDPGIGGGTPLTVATPADTVSLAVSIPTASLTSGAHNLFIRFQYDNGTWGLYEGRPFYIFTGATINTAKINLAEYFFDHDPGVGSGTPVTVTPATDTAALVLGSISASGLAAGTHYIFFRFRYDNGTWGLYQGGKFTIVSCTAPAAHITASGTTTFCFGDSVVLSANTGSTLSYQWYRNGATLTGATHNTYTVHDSSGTYTVIVTDTSGCDSTSNAIVVTVKSQLSSSVSAAICQGNSYTFNGHALTASGTYYDTIAASGSCDSIITLTLTVTSVINTQVAASICSGSSYSFNGQILTSSGTYHDTLPSSGGCDSVVTLTLNVNPGTTSSISASVCSGQSYMFNGQTLTSAGTYTDTLNGSDGCDSIVTLHLSTYNQVNDTINADICTGSTYSFNGQTLSAAGVYSDTVSSGGGCDSITTLILTVGATTGSTQVLTICGSSYNFNGIPLNASGNYTDTLTAASGCDSIVTLQLTLNPSYDSLTVVTICGGDSFIYNGITYTASTTISDTLTTVNGCDSIISLQLTVPPAIVNPFTLTVCNAHQYVYNGDTLTLDGTYTDTLTSASGCDSIVILNLRFSGVDTTQTSASICAGSSYSFYGRNLTTAGIYLDTLTSHFGCDSIIMLSLTVMNPPVVSWPGGNDTICTKSAAIILSGGIPSGGSYSGQGVSGGIFHPDSVAAGRYVITYTVADTAGCADSALKLYVVNICTGIDEVAFEQFVRIYPNPATNLLNVVYQLSNDLEITISVTDLEGRDVLGAYQGKQYQGQYTYQINVSDLAAGVYMLRFAGQGLNYTSKFVKQ